MKLLAAIAAASIAMVASGAATAQQELAQKSGCLNCHAVDTKKVGPAFRRRRGQVQGQGGRRGAARRQGVGREGHPAVKASPDDVKVARQMGAVHVDQGATPASKSRLARHFL